MTLTCSESSFRAGERLGGTAPTALTWLVLEHDGPWGRVALQDADLDASVRVALQRLADAGVGVLLARRPGSRRGRPRSSSPEVLLARAATGGMLLRRAVALDLTTLATWDPVRVAQGSLPPIGPIDDRPILLVCTQGRRDACCARDGRALLTALEAASAEAGAAEAGAAKAGAATAGSVELWESSHIGGHRLAPVTLALPSGAVHGRVRPDEAAALLQAVSHHQVLPSHLRGRSALPAPLQAAEVALRQMITDTGASSVDVLVSTPERPMAVGPDWMPPDGEVELELRHVDGRTWRTRVRRVQHETCRLESCGGEPAPLREWDVAPLQPGAPWF